MTDYTSECNVQRVTDILNMDFENSVWVVNPDDRCATVWVSGMNVGCTSIARNMIRRLEDCGMSCGEIQTEGGIYGGVEFHVE